MLTLTAEILSALIGNAQDHGIYSDEIEAGIAAAEGYEVGYSAPLDIENGDYPTKIELAATGVKGDKLTVTYTVNAGTESEKVHVAATVYLRDLE